MEKEITIELSEADYKRLHDGLRTARFYHSTAAKKSIGWVAVGHLETRMEYTGLINKIKSQGRSQKEARNE